MCKEWQCVRAHSVVFSFVYCMCDPHIFNWFRSLSSRVAPVHLSSWQASEWPHPFTSLKRNPPVFHNCRRSGPAMQEAEVVKKDDLITLLPSRHTLAMFVKAWQAVNHTSAILKNFRFGGWRQKMHFQMYLHCRQGFKECGLTWNMFQWIAENSCASAKLWHLRLNMWLASSFTSYIVEENQTWMTNDTKIRMLWQDHNNKAMKVNEWCFWQHMDAYFHLTFHVNSHFQLSHCTLLHWPIESMRLNVTHEQFDAAEEWMEAMSDRKLEKKHHML